MIRRHIVVVGGGITGLSAAWRLSHPTEPSNDAFQVTVLEAADTFGGKIQTSEFAGLPVDHAADAFLARVPEGRQLCEELGIEDSLVAPAATNALVWSRGELHDFPKDTVLGVPSDLDTITDTGIVSKRGIFRARAEAMLPQSVGRESDDPTIGELIGSRFGDEILDRLVDPLLGGINGGSARQLSVASAAPQLKALATKDRSLLSSARAQLNQMSEETKQSPVFLAPQNGMHGLVETLVEQLTKSGVAMQSGAAVSEITYVEDSWHVVVGTKQIAADALILATPATQTAQLLQKLAPEAATQLNAIEYASVTMIRLAYSRQSIKHDLNASGLVVPAVEKRLLTACSFASSKWQRLSDSDTVIMRASVGRFGDERGNSLSDDELIAAAHNELSEMLGIENSPLAADVTRHYQSFPQYFPGHDKRVTAIEDKVDQLCHLAVAGAAYRGIGIPACIRSGWRAANEVAASLLDEA